MSRIVHLDPIGFTEALLAEHPWARRLAEQLALLEQQLGQEAMALIFEFFEAETEASDSDDARLREVVAKIETFERSRGRL